MQARLDVIEALAGYLNEIGVKVTIQEFEMGQFNQNWILHAEHAVGSPLGEHAGPAERRIVCFLHGLDQSALQRGGHGAA